MYNSFQCDFKDSSLESGDSVHYIFDTMVHEMFKVISIGLRNRRAKKMTYHRVQWIIIVTRILEKSERICGALSEN